MAELDLGRALRFVVLAQVIMVLAIGYVVWDLEQQQQQLKATQEELVASAERSRANAQLRVEAFCTAEFDIRVVLADTLTIIARDPEDTTSTAQARRRRIADSIERRLRSGMPDQCDEYVDTEDIIITTDPVDPQP